MEKVRCNRMRMVLVVVVLTIVAFVQKVWEFVKKFFGEKAEKPLVDEETTA